MNAIYIDAQAVRAKIERLSALYPELAEDESLRIDMFEGETDLHRIIEKALAEELDASMMADALGSRLTALNGRLSRFRRKQEAMRSLIKSLMKSAQVGKVRLTEATVLLTSARSTVGIEDLDAIPQGYFTTTKQADKAAIKAAFDRGEEIPGALLVTGEEGLSIRTK